MIKCLYCHNEFVPINHIQKYCSKKCYSNAKQKRYSLRIRETITKVCENCGKEFNPNTKYVKNCSRKCANQSMANKQRKYLDIPDCLNSKYRKIDKNIGYIRIYAPMHPEANTWGYVYEHRIIAEQILGRRLLSNEVVHHINGIRHDNRPENLDVMDKIEHSKLKK